METAQEIYSRLKWTTRIRPMVVGAYIANLLAPARRRYVPTKSGLTFYVDPLANLGEELIKHGEYEPETEKLFRELLGPGDTFLDVGANEGYFTTLAASIVGANGHVVAVEPQKELCEVIEINLSANKQYAVVLHGALGGIVGQDCDLFLYPSLNTGAASIVRKPKLYRRIEKSPFIDPQNLLEARIHCDLVKVDVEGFEKNVIESLLPLLQQGKIWKLLLDYHATILAENEVNPEEIEGRILSAGMRLVGSPNEYQGYRLYQWGEDGRRENTSSNNNSADCGNSGLGIFSGHSAVKNPLVLIMILAFVAVMFWYGWVLTPVAP